ncbi:MAG TPA: methyltransferase domain-containing protein, partial [Segetibacter sp.]
KNVQFLVADYLHTPFNDNSFDVVWAFESVCHAPEKRLFYKEAYRILKPGGKLLMAEYLRTGRPMTGDKEALLTDIFYKWAIPDLDTISEHRDHATRTGFTSFKNRDVTKHVMKSYNNLRETCKKYSGLSKMLNTLGVISSVRYNNMLGSLKQADAIEKGVFTYHHIVAEK